MMVINTGSASVVSRMMIMFHLLLRFVKIIDWIMLTTVKIILGDNYNETDMD